MGNFEKYVIKKFLKQSRYYQEPNLEMAIWEFRYICFKLNYFMRLKIIISKTIHI
jgi:hypothetical protein